MFFELMLWAYYRLLFGKSHVKAAIAVLNMRLYSIRSLHLPSNGTIWDKNHFEWSFSIFDRGLWKIPKNGLIGNGKRIQWLKVCNDIVVTKPTEFRKLGLLNAMFLRSFSSQNSKRIVLFKRLLDFTPNKLQVSSQNSICEWKCQKGKRLWIMISHNVSHFRL